MSSKNDKDDKVGKDTTPKKATPQTASSSGASSGASSGTSDINGLDDDKDSGKPLKLSSKDKKDFMVERKHAFISTLVKTSLENDDKAEEVPIPGVTGAILDLVVTYMREHKGVEPVRRICLLCNYHSF